MDTPTTTPPKIGIIISSTRIPRVCPQIATFVQSTIQSITTTIPTQPPTTHLIDLSTWSLPFSTEPGIPSQIKHSAGYTHATTRAWSTEISAYDAFIFVTPQYNWGYPAPLKNAIDYLYHEWAGKPALVVSYGGHGGGKCNAQLREVLAGVRMKVLGGVELEFANREVLGRAARGQDIGLQLGSGEGVWGEEGNKIVEGYLGILRVLGGCEGSG